MQFIENNPTFLCYFSNWHFKICLPKLLKWSLAGSPIQLWAFRLPWTTTPSWCHAGDRQTDTHTRTTSLDKVPRMQTQVQRPSVPGIPTLLAWWAFIHETSLSKKESHLGPNTIRLLTSRVKDHSLSKSSRGGLLIRSRGSRGRLRSRDIKCLAQHQTTHVVT